jgi:hypothetical protein
MTEHAYDALIHELCRIIAVHSPFSLQEILNAYEALQSIDQVLIAVKEAVTAGCPLDAAVMSIHEQLRGGAGA